MQKIFQLYLIRKVKQNFGQLNIENKFDFLTHFDYDKYYKFILTEKTYSRAGVTKDDRNDTSKIVTNILTIFDSKITPLFVGRIFFKHYAQIVLQVFLFNSEHHTLKINQKNWKILLFIHFIYFVFNYALFLFLFWLAVDYFTNGLTENVELKRRK
ncbi:hypothetical protein [Mycoplasma sp. 'Moose RK']|uniref:hypothetical protein n=1 Tax=Mycoplasma sp. 'Moose RK' TaxID=2780095 RepID=UPI0018C220AD|nr:hypothetical protein [Mycoplasma sp. 'Moose RK']MBG0730789.1 hypothetical protein [Mycoplasma sp. 'Moose RK']